MTKKAITKKYSNGAVTILWQPALCAHSGNCVRQLASVFNPKEKPWIKMQNASTGEITAAVGHCPSGALSLIESRNPKQNDRHT